jgi:hypothetical protein
VRAKQVLLRVGGWEDVTVGDDARGQMLPNKAIGPLKRQESTWGYKTYREILQKKFVPGKNIVIDESTVEFKHKIIFKIHNPKKPMKWGIRLFALAESDTGYVHSIIPNYAKLTGDVCNLPYSEKPFISRTDYDSVCLVLKTTTISLTDIIAVLAGPRIFFSFGATAPIWALAYLHEAPRFT